jgi:hypothetical protein
MLRTFVLTVFTETDSSLAIVGKYRNTLNSLGLSSSVSGAGCWLLAVRSGMSRAQRRWVPHRR